MKCFYHPEADAIAICKNCNRGLCTACATDLGNGLACKGRCEAEVQSLLEVQQRAKTGYQKAAGAAGRMALWMALMGVMFLAVGLLTLKSAGPVMLVFGLFFLLGAAFQYVSARRFRRVD